MPVQSKFFLLKAMPQKKILKTAVICQQISYQYSFEVIMQGGVQVEAVCSVSKAETQVGIFTALGYFYYKVSGKWQN